MTESLTIKNRIRELRNIPTTELLANPGNFRRHPKSQMDALEGVLREVGLAGALLVYESERNGGLTIIDGHARIETGVESWPCLVLDVNDEEADYLLATHDALAAMADLDPVALAQLLERVHVEDSSVQGMLDQLVELAGRSTAGTEGQTDEDEIPEVPEEPVSQRGEIYQLGDHRLIVGDATDAECLARLMDGQSADLVLTDPPYNVAYVGKTRDALTIQNDAMSDEDFRAFLVKAFTLANAHLREGGAFYVFHADSEGLAFRGACEDSGWTVRQCLVWAKNTMVMGRQDYQWKHEPCLYGWKAGAAHRWYSDRCQTTVLEFDRPSRSEEHPTMKPVALVEYLMGNSSAPGQRVLDPFAGSGSTVIAAEKSGRAARAAELDPKYADVIRRRWAEFVYGEGCNWQERTPAVEAGVSQGSDIKR